MMNWVPVVFITFKVLVFGTGMFFAIKWHHDQRKIMKKPEDAGCGELANRNTF